MTQSTVSLDIDQFYVLAISGTKRLITDRLFSGGSVPKGFTTPCIAGAWLKNNPQPHPIEVEARSLVDYHSRGFTHITLDGYLADVAELAAALDDPFAEEMRLAA